MDLSPTMEDRDRNDNDSGSDSDKDDTNVPEEEISLSAFSAVPTTAIDAYTHQQLVDLTHLLINEVRLRRDRVDPRVVHIRLPGDETRVLARRSHVVFPHWVDLEQLKEERRASTDNIAGMER